MKNTKNSVFTLIFVVSVICVLLAASPVNEESAVQQLQLLPYPSSDKLITIKSGKEYLVSPGRRLIITHITRISNSLQVYLTIDSTLVFKGRLPRTGVLELPRIVVKGGSKVYMPNGSHSSSVLMIHGYLESETPN